MLRRRLRHGNAAIADDASATRYANRLCDCACETLPHCSTSRDFAMIPFLYSIFLQPRSRRGMIALSSDATIYFEQRDPSVAQDDSRRFAKVAALLVNRETSFCVRRSNLILETCANFK